MVKTFHNFIIAQVDYHYCDFLRQYDNKVFYNSGKKELRPFIGILFKVDDCEYFAPLSSPKDKHKTMKSQMDMIKIDNCEYGVVNFNNMIPVTSKNYEILNLNKKLDDFKALKRQYLLRNELRWLNNHSTAVLGKARRLYNEYINDKLPERIKARCCNFSLLEEKCKEYNFGKIKNIEDENTSRFIEEQINNLLALKKRIQQYPELRLVATLKSKTERITCEFSNVTNGVLLHTVIGIIPKTYESFVKEYDYTTFNVNDVRKKRHSNSKQSLREKNTPMST